jgi:hypothetical protein
MDKNNNLALGLMVKNEESTVIKTLLSVVNVNLISDLYMFDTGSTDNTINLVKDFCSKYTIKLHLMEGEFESFSESRNKLLDFIEADLPYGKFYFILDANDEIRVGDNFNLNNLLNAHIDQKVIMVNSYWKNGFSILCHLKILFIRAKTGVRYHGSIHEYLKVNNEVLEDNEVKRVMQDEISIFQDRVEDELKSIDRAGRDIELLKKDIKNDVYPGRNTYLVGRTYFNTEQHTKALKWFKKAIDFVGLITPEEKFQAHYYSSIIKKRKNNSDWILHIFDAYELVPDKIENILFMCMYLAVTERWRTLHIFAKKAIKLSKKFDYALTTNVLYNDTDYKLYCWYYHVMSSFHLNKYKKCYESLKVLTTHVGEYNNDIDEYFADFKDSYTMFKNIFMPFDFNHQIKNRQIKNHGVSDKINEEFEEEFIVLFGGHGYDKWDARSINSKNGLGGAETVIINIATQLSKKMSNNYNINIVVFCDTSENILYDGVYYIKLELYEIFVTCRKIKTLFVFRFIDYIRYYDNIDKVVLVLEDYVPVGNVLHLNTKLKAIICKTNWHKNNLLTIYPDLNRVKHKIRVIGNAINISRFGKVNEIKKSEWRFIYSSCMTRGLNNLLDMWLKIKEVVPEATLHLFVAYECPFYKPEHRINEMINQINNLGIHGVINHGRVSQDELAIEIMKSDIWLHPTLTPETYCITALEMQMGKVLCISSNIGGVQESVGDRGILVDYDNNDVYINIIKNIRDKKIDKNTLVQKGYDWAKLQDWANISEKFVDLC